MRPGSCQILICIAVVALLFGANKIPEIARSLGRAKGEFKKGLQEGEKEDAAECGRVSFWYEYEFMSDIWGELRTSSWRCWRVLFSSPRP